MNTTILSTIPLGDGLFLRPVRSEDKALLRAGFERLSPASRYQRFLSPTTRLTDRQLAYFSEIDHRDHFAWALVSGRPPHEEGVAVARYVRLREEPAVAEAAFAVLDSHQGHGFGGFLADALAVAAAVNEIEQFRCYVLAGNGPMLAILRRRGAVVTPEEGGLVRADLAGAPIVAGIADSEQVGRMRAVARAAAG